jgi:hypothetical protein
VSAGHIHVFPDFMNVGEQDISHIPRVQRLVPFVGFVHFVLHPPQLELS